MVPKSGAFYAASGFVVYRDPLDRWANSRPVWNQHAYSEDGASIAFTAALDVDDGVQVVGATFEDIVAVDSAGPLRLQMVTRDEVEGVTLFDGLDFAALDEDGDGAVTIVPGDAAHNIFRRALPSHAFYYVIAP